MVSKLGRHLLLVATPCWKVGRHLLPLPYRCRHLCLWEEWYWVCRYWRLLTRSCYTVQWYRKAMGSATTLSLIASSFAYRRSSLVKTQNRVVSRPVWRQHWVRWGTCVSPLTMLRRRQHNCLLPFIVRSIYLGSICTWATYFGFKETKYYSFHSCPVWFPCYIALASSRSVIDWPTTNLGSL